VYETLQFICDRAFWGHVIDSMCSPTLMRVDHSSCNPHAHRLRGRRSEPLSPLTITITTANEDTFTSTGCQSADLVTDIALTASSLFRENQSPISYNRSSQQPLAVCASQTLPREATMWRKVLVRQYRAGHEFHHHPLAPDEQLETEEDITGRMP
jgi:hypothetical protein